MKVGCTEYDAPSDTWTIVIPTPHPVAKHGLGLVVTREMLDDMLDAKAAKINFTTEELLRDWIKV